jgi:O-antigen biosynthesis protein
MEAATGEVMAYIDDDAYPDPHWLTYLAATFLSDRYVGVGGPNITAPGDGWIADCIANAPGNPTHILLSDREAEHIPGCNMAFRKAALEAIGGFDSQFRAAGDDVDVCWRLRQQGEKLGFSPAAIVWHHRRNSLRAYWKQQQGYGKAEALLERKWPEKYNPVGHLVWAGRLYGNGITRTLGWSQGRIYYGSWGSALFQSVYQPTPRLLCSLPLMPEWYLLIVALAGLSALSILWAPLLFALPLLAITIIIPLIQAGLSAAHASFITIPQSSIARLKMHSLTAFLHLLQPLARWWGRLSNGLTPWRRRGTAGFSFPWPRTSTIWSEHWQPPEAWLRSLERALRTDGAIILRGGYYDRWDLEVRGGLLGAARTLMVIEEHGAGRQLVKFRIWPRWLPGGGIVILLFASLSAGAALDQAWLASVILGVVATLTALRTLQEYAATTVAILLALKQGDLAGA